MARAVRELQSISGLDEKLEEIHSTLLDLESLLSDKTAKVWPIQFGIL